MYVHGASDGHDGFVDVTLAGNPRVLRVLRSNLSVLDSTPSTSHSCETPPPLHHRSTSIPIVRGARDGGVPEKRPARGEVEAADVDVAKVLFSEDLVVLQAFCVTGEAEKTVCMELLSWAQRCGRVPRLLRAAIRGEASRQTRPSTLFRGNSIASKVMGECARHVGSGYLVLVLRPLLEFCKSEDATKLEVDPRRISPGASLEANTRHLGELAQFFVDVICNSLAHVPASLCIMCRLLRQETEAKFPGSGDVCVGGFFFLRFFCPAIVTPSIYGITMDALPPTLMRPLILLTKILQALSNGVLFGKKEAYMVPMNTVVSKNIPRIQKFLRAVCDVAEEHEEEFEWCEDGPGHASDGPGPVVLGALHAALPRMSAHLSDHNDGDEAMRTFTHALLRPDTTGGKAECSSWVEGEVILPCGDPKSPRNGPFTSPRNRTPVSPKEEKAANVRGTNEGDDGDEPFIFKKESLIARNADDPMTSPAEEPIASPAEEPLAASAMEEAIPQDPSVKLIAHAMEDDSSSFSATSTYSLAGYLHKRPPASRVRISLQASKRRWFVLHPSGHLTYQTHPGAEKVLQHIPLAHVQRVHPSPCSSKDGFEFEIHTPERVWQLIAPSRDEMTRWIGAIRAAIDADCCGSSRTSPASTKKPSSPRATKVLSPRNRGSRMTEEMLMKDDAYEDAVAPVKEFMERLSAERRRQNQRCQALEEKIEIVELLEQDVAKERIALEEAKQKVARLTRAINAISDL